MATIFQIRRYTAVDEPGWLQCRLLSMFQTDFYDDVKVAKTRFEGEHIELVADYDGAIVGLIDVTIDGDAATIDSIAVHPTAQRAGVGRGLLASAREQLPPTVRTLDAWTRENPASNAWYEAAGFTDNYRFMHVYRGEDDPPFSGPPGMSVPVLAYMHASMEREDELRATYKRVYVCRQYLLEL